MTSTANIARYTPPAANDLCAGNRKITAKKRVKKLADGCSLYCAGFNHREEDCAAMKKAQTVDVAGMTTKKEGTGTDSEQSGKD